MPPIQGNYTDITYKLPPDFTYKDPSGVFSVCWLSKVLKGTFCFQLAGYGTKCTEGETKLTEGKEIKCSIELGTEKAKFTYEHTTKCELERTWKHSKCEVCQPTMCLDGTMVICNCEYVVWWSDSKWQVIQFIQDSPSNGKFDANCVEDDKKCVNCQHAARTAGAPGAAARARQVLEIPTQQYATRVLRAVDFTSLPSETEVKLTNADFAGRYSDILETIAQPTDSVLCNPYYKFGVQDYAGRVAWIFSNDGAAILRHLTLLSVAVSRPIDDAAVVRGPRYRLPILAVGPCMPGATAAVNVEIRSHDDHNIAALFSVPASVVIKKLTTVWAEVDLSKFGPGSRGTATLQVNQPEGLCGVSVTEPFIITDGPMTKSEPLTRASPAQKAESLKGGKSPRRR
jgi:hypothetical protein